MQQQLPDTRTDVDGSQKARGNVIVDEVREIGSGENT